MSKLYDVVVVGGGAVGSAMCAALGKFVPSAGLKVAMVEAGDLYAKARRDAGVYSNRVSSINEDTVAFLKNVGAWDRIDTDRKRPFRTMEVWDGKGNGKVNFGATGQPTGDGLSSIAWIIENSMLTESLASSLDPGITVYNRAKVQAIKQEDDTTGWPEVQLQDGTILKTRLLVGADGANSVVRKFAKIETTGWDYAQNAIVATMRVQSEEMPPNYTAYQRFLKHGPIALLPLDNDVSSLVWSTTPSVGSKLMKLTSTDFARFVDVAFRNPIQDIDFLCDQVTDDGRVNVDVATEAEWGRARDPSYLSISVLNDFAGSRAQFPLRLRNSLEYVKDRVALVGDAAHTIHPLAGQGLNLGFADVECFARVLKKGLSTGQDLGSIHVLQEYARERYVKNLGMMVAVDAIGRVFRSDFQPLVWARSLGFDLVNRIPQIKSGTVACKERVEKTHIEKERSKMAALPNVRVPFSQLTKFADPKNLWWKAPSLHAWVWNFNPPTSQIGLIELDRNVFGVPNRQDILYRALRYEQSWKEGGTESSKALGQVRGSTRKIVPQKGRGAARHGSKRSALFVGGYNVHGPRPHDKTTDLQKKVYNLAIRTALSVKFAQNQLFVVDSLSMNELSKSKLYESLKGMEVFGKKCYCMYGSDEPETMLIRSADATTKSEEGKQVLVSSARNISVGPVLENNFLICDKSAIEVLEEMYREDEAYEDDEDGED